MVSRGHVPQRTCAGCGQKIAKDRLVRFAVLGEGPGRDVVLDRGRTGKGRGAYLCPRIGCYDRAAKKNALVRRLRGAAVPPGLKDNFDLFIKGKD